MKRKITPEKAIDLKQKVERIDERIEKLQAERDQCAQALAELIAEYHPGDVIQKEGHNVGLWLVEGAASCRCDLDRYSVQVRKLKKDGTPSKITTGFESSWDLKTCTLVERRKP